MKSVSGKEFCSVLGKRGWQFRRVKGSHHIYSKPGKRMRISVPVHGNKTLKIGLQAYFMKIAQIKESDL